MIITEKVKYRGKDILVNQLKPNSEKKIKVMCPQCNEIRDTTYKSYHKAQSDVCLKCFNKTKRKNVDLIKVNKLSVIAVSKVGYSICKCECGSVIEVSNYNLLSGRTKSCGCLKRQNFITAKVCKKNEHGNWKGGITSEQNVIRKSVKYRNWRTSVFERDNYKCQKCNQIGGDLNAHHIIPFGIDKNRVYDKANGLTLCHKCHNEFHKIYGYKCSEENIREYLR